MAGVTLMMASVIQAGEQITINLSKIAMKRNLAYILGVLFVMTSCVEEKVLDNIVPTPGDEVEFTAGLNTGVQTKTLYGADNGTNPIKVKWVNGDKIMVYGTTCTKGSDCQVAEYQVSTSATTTPNADDGQNVADGLDKTGDIGVRWGSAATSDFVAVYPSENASFSYNETSKVVTATTSIKSTQNYVFNDNPTIKSVNGKDISVWEGTHFANDATNPSMQNAIMYARTDDVQAGKPVGLSFKPFSTVLKFRFMGFDSNLFPNTEIYIQNIKITAPGYHIAGDFDMIIPRNADLSETNPVKATSKNNSTNTNTVTINTIKAGGSYLKLAANQVVEFNVFTVPLSGLTMTSTKPWTVTIQAQGYEPWVYNMIPTAEEGYTLLPGLIHKVKVPKLISKTEVPWDPSQWITQIPEEVYLSQLSVPGAWYCMDDGYQGSIGLDADKLTYQSQKTNDANGNVVSFYTTSNASNGIDDGLENLYYNGVRAFNIDCRTSITGGRVTSSWNDENYTNGKSYLACSGTEEPGSYIFYHTMTEGIHVKDAMSDLVALAKAHPDEYIVVIFTFAEKPCMEKDLATWTYGSINPIFISEQLSEILNDATISPYLYKNITSETTIEDVLKPNDGIVSNVIVKINHSNKSFYSGNTFTMPDGIMASYASMTMDGHGLDNAPAVTLTEFSSMQEQKIYNGKTLPSNQKQIMTYYYHQAQKTEESETAAGTTNPSIYDRLKAVDEILKKATEIYDDKESHNGLFQLGIGGSLDDNPYNLAKKMNAAVQTKIEAKLASYSDVSPLGFVLMNYALDATYGLPLVKDILEMNGKIWLKREGDDVITGGGTQGGNGGTTPTPAPAKNAAYAEVGEDAF